MNILEKITLGKYKEVEERKAFVSVAELERSEFFSKPTISLKHTLENPNGKHGIIAEFKRKSPSKGIFNE